MLAAVPLAQTDFDQVKHQAAPERSQQQRMDALQRANHIRTQRAQLKRDLRAGVVSIDSLLLKPPAFLETAKVVELAPGGSEVRARQGQPGPAAVPDLAEQDNRRTL